MKKILLCGGGTAGHVMPNIAIIEALEGRAELFYIGAGGMERALIGRISGVRYEEISAPKFRRSLALSNLALPFQLAKSVRQAGKMLKKIAPDAVFSKGGYAALPVVLAARHARIHCAGHESDSSVGLAHRLARSAYMKFFTQFPDAARQMRGVEYVGAPLRRGMLTASAANGRKIAGFDGGAGTIKTENGARGKNGVKRPLVLCMGGSSGAMRLNAEILSAARSMPAFDFFMLCGAGKLFEAEKLPKNVRQAEFCDKIFDLYAAADLAVTRGGANSLAELAAARVPFIAVPLTKASRGEQVKNAEFFAQNTGTRTIFEEQINAESLAGALKDLSARRIKIQAAMAALPPSAAEKIADELLKI